MRDFARGATFDVFLKDAANDMRLNLDNDALAAFSGERGISVRQAASSQVLLESSSKATTHLMRQVATLQNKIGVSDPDNVA